MRSTFLGFNTLRSGLFAAQRALDVTGHNIANVNTRGFSRQRLLQKPAFPMMTTGAKAILGTGVETTNIKQIRDDFLDFKYRQESNTQAQWETKRDGLRFIESIFNEPSDTGIVTIVDEIFKSFNDVSKNPENLAARTQLLERANTFTNSINYSYQQLEKMAIDINQELRTVVGEINMYATQIASLNDQIHRSEFGGAMANDLRDQRNLMIDELSRLVNIDVIEMRSTAQEAEGTLPKLSIKINGQILVSHDRTYMLETEERESIKFDGEEDQQISITKVKWKNGPSLNTKSLKGELKAIIDLRDGKGAESKGIPYYISRLNEFAKTFAQKVNDLHKQGYGLNGNTLEGVGNDHEGAGYLFFAANGGFSKDMYNADGTINYQKINAKNIGVAREIQWDINKIAASSSLELLPGDGSIALMIGEIRQNTTLFEQGKPEDYLKSIITNLGVDAQEAIRNSYNFELLKNQIDKERQSVSSVSIDEEMSNMVRFQHAYNASARMMTTMDEMIDIVINRIGLVGR